MLFIDTLFARSLLFSFEGAALKVKENMWRRVRKAEAFAYKAGVDDGEVPPVPIPNTEVKLTCAEDSWLETACENR